MIMKIILIVVAFCYLMSMFYYHSTYYDVEKDNACSKDHPVKIYSWHVHVLFWQSNEEHKKGALEVREKFLDKFSHLLGPQCKHFFHQNYNCMFPTYDKPIGPFLTAQWAVFILFKDFYKIWEWFLQYRGKYDILLHLNSGCELLDHTAWAAWGGNKWELDNSAFKFKTPFHFGRITMLI